MDFTESPIKIIFLVIGTVVWTALIIYILSIFIKRFVDPNHKKKQNAWLKINWKWFVPAVIAFIVVLDLSMNQLMKYHEVYKDSVNLLNQSSIAEEILGEPINLGFFIKGKVSLLGGGRIYYSVSGPKGKGTLIAEGSLKNGKCIMHYTNIILDSGKKIKLIENN